MLSLGMENVNAIQEAFEYTWPGPILLPASWPLHIVHGVIRLPLLVVTLGWARLIRVARLFFLLLLSDIEGRLLGQGIFVGDCQHLFWHPGVLHGELADKGRVPKSLLEEYDDRLVIDLRYNVSLVAVMLDKLPEGLSFLLDHAG
jgi:hypothetical protein